MQTTIIPRHMIETEHPLPPAASEKGWRLAECFRDDSAFAILAPDGEVLTMWPSGVIPTNGEVDDKVADLVAAGG